MVVIPFHVGENLQPPDEDLTDESDSFLPDQEITEVTKVQKLNPQLKVQLLPQKSTLLQVEVPLFYSS